MLHPVIYSQRVSFDGFCAKGKDVALLNQDHSPMYATSLALAYDLEGDVAGKEIEDLFDHN